MATHTISSRSPSPLPAAEALTMNVLSKWKVEFSKHSLGGNGTKSELIKRLQALSQQGTSSFQQGTHSISVNHANHTQQPEVTNCKCGVIRDDGHPMVKCSNCL